MNLDAAGIIMNALLEKIADKLNVSESQENSAKSSYEAVGTWLHGVDELHDIRIMPQGSFNLGTVIKPPSDNDDGYDIDLICLLDNISVRDISARRLKKAVGERLHNNNRYAMRLENEGKRCWTIDFSGFHMDILPSIPNLVSFSNSDKAHTEIKLTHTDDKELYTWKQSNPCEYKKWFDTRMQILISEERLRVAKARNFSIDKVPPSQARTPLQKSIQLLKRHRDKMFAQNKEDAPISIIITTLAALAYNNEPDVYSAIVAILNNMDKFIIQDSLGNYHVDSPVMLDSDTPENFADKWNVSPNKRDSFFSWLKNARKNILDDPQKACGLDKLGEIYATNFSQKFAMESLNEYGREISSARDNGQLHIRGLTGGLSTIITEASTPVKKHTFYGK